MNPFATVSNITKKYGNHTVLDNIIFEVPSGNIFVIIGPNGAGKTTLLKILSGLLRPSSGEVTIKGLDYAKSELEIKKIIGFMPEESSTYDTMTIKDYIVFFGQMYDVGKKKIHERLSALLRDLDLEDSGQVIGNLSKGQRRKVLLTRSLINDPDILIYDELASGLDPITTSFLLSFIKQLKAKGKTIIYSAHHLSYIEEICDKLLILNKGKTEFLGTIQELKKDSTDYVLRYKTSTSKLLEKKFSSLKEIIGFINSNKITLYDFIHREKRIEDIFIQRFKLSNNH